MGLFGHGSTIVFSEQHRNEHGPSDPWLVLTRKAKKCPGSDFYNGRAVCRPLGRRARDHDRGRRRTSARGHAGPASCGRSRSAAACSIAGASAQESSTARLRGRVLAVQHGTTVDAYDAQTGAKRQSRELLTDGGPPPFLLGVQGDLVVYETGGATPPAAPVGWPGQGSAGSWRRALARRQPRAGWAVRQLEQDARPPAGPNRVHPVADDRRPLVGGGDEGGQPQALTAPACLMTRPTPDPIERPGSVHGSGFRSHTDSRSRAKTSRTGGNDVQVQQDQDPSASRGRRRGRGGRDSRRSRPRRGLELRVGSSQAGVWRELPDAPAAIAAGRTTVWTGSEMIVTGFTPGSDGTSIGSAEVAQAYNPARTPGGSFRRRRPRRTTAGAVRRGRVARCSSGAAD